MLRTVQLFTHSYNAGINQRTAVDCAIFYKTSKWQNTSDCLSASLVIYNTGRNVSREILITEVCADVLPWTIETFQLQGFCNEVDLTQQVAPGDKESFKLLRKYSETEASVWYCTQWCLHPWRMYSDTYLPYKAQLSSVSWKSSCCVCNYLTHDS